MEAIQRRVRLAESAAAAPIARPALPIRRAAAEEALRDGDGPVELTFDVVRVGGRTEAITLTMERSDLERTLQSADGDELALVFNPDELEWAIDGPDVEAQGLRETAAVLTVAVAAMAGSAGAAMAATGGASGTGYVVPAGSHAAIVSNDGAVGASGTGYVVPAGGDQTIVSDDGAVGASGTGYVIPAGSDQAIVNDAGVVGASGTGYVVPAGGDQAIVSDDGAVGASGTGYVIPAGSDQAIVNDASSEGTASTAAGGASGTGYVVPAGGDQAIVSDDGAVGASGTGYVIPAGGDQAIVNDAGTTSASVPSSAGDGAGLSSTDAAAIGTGAILLVAGAAFAATRTKRRPGTSDVAPA
ncbi:MAG TPA: hypothetical protein VIR59_09430 [Gaiellaceae bacterium]